MSTDPDSELGREVSETIMPERRLESLDDITREISDRRLQAEFADLVTPEKTDALINQPDRLEKPGEFESVARAAGVERTDGVLGWSTNLESPAHVRKGEVPQEIATLIHEDLHRLTAPETLHEMTSTPALRELYEGITEYLTNKATEGLHEYEAGECYPKQTEAANLLASEVGEDKLRVFFFKHELPGEIQAAIDRLGVA